MMIENPAKRLRILQSVEVDETNPEYIEAKRKQQQKFKSNLERIFDKYGSMHESMSDEIDFKTGKVVVDRGHFRRIQRQLTRNGPTLVDNFLGPALGENTSSGEDEEQAQSEDELAPAQSLKRKRDSVGVSKENAQISVKQSTIFVENAQAVPTALIQNRIPNASNPATSLLEGIHFPQTPLGQQAQAAFVANLNQTIVQAVQQVVAPLFGIPQNTPSAQVSKAQFPVPALRLSPVDTVRPAADPKWYFPPISAAKRMSEVEQPRSSPPVVETVLPFTDNINASSPLVARRRSPKVHIQRKTDASERKRVFQRLESSLERSHVSNSLPTSRKDAISCLTPKPIAETVHGNATKRSKSNQKYHFTDEDDAYISQSRELHNMSFRDIQRSKAKWSEWPPSAIRNRWNNHLKGRKSSQQITSECPLASTEREEHFFSSIEIPETSSAEHHLPTPSSLEQGNNSVEPIVVPLPCHFDEDDLELLSLAGADVTNAQHVRTFDDEEDNCPAPDEPLPSIEGAEFRNEDELQRDLEEESQQESLKIEQWPTPEPPLTHMLPSTIPETQESAVVASSPSPECEIGGRIDRKPVAMYRASSDSSEDLDLIGTGDEPAIPHIHIKREVMTPQASRILCSSPVFKTPKPIQQTLGVAKSTGKLNRRAFLNDVKKGWAKSNGKMSGSQKRRSLNVPPRATKVALIDVEAEDSEDELAV